MSVIDSATVWFWHADFKIFVYDYKWAFSVKYTKTVASRKRKARPATLGWQGMGQSPIRNQAASQQNERSYPTFERLATSAVRCERSELNERGTNLFVQSFRKLMKRYRKSRRSGAFVQDQRRKPKPKAKTRWSPQRQSPPRRCTMPKRQKTQDPSILSGGEPIDGSCDL